MDVLRHIVPALPAVPGQLHLSWLPQPALRQNKSHRQSRSKPINTGERMIKTTLAAIMARMAAYTGKKVTQEMALNSEEQLVPDADKIAWDMEFPPKPPRKAGTDAAVAPHKWKV